MEYAPRCHLTPKDINALEIMLERRGAHDAALARLLRRKLAAARIVFADDIDPHTATINSRVAYRVDGGPVETRILVHAGGDAVAGLPVRSLPVTTLRGLALLGLTAPAEIDCERPDGAREVLTLCGVLHQPEAARRGRAWARQGAVGDTVS